jgi:hypothetical protein
VYTVGGERDFEVNREGEEAVQFIIVGEPCGPRLEIWLSDI